MPLRSVLVSLLLALGWAGYTQNQPPNLQSDERLQQLVTFQAKIINLRDFVKTLAEKTKVPLGVDKAFEQEKLTLFVKEKPAWEVMKHAVAVLGLEWQTAKNEGYFIARSKQRTEEERAEQKRRHQQRERLESKLRALQRTATQYSYDQLIAEYQRLIQERQAIEARKPEGWQDKMTQIADLLYQLELVSKLPNYLLGRLSAQWTPAQWQNFWQGTPFLAKYPAHPKLAILAPEVRAWYAQYRYTQSLTNLPSGSTAETLEPSDLPTDFYCYIRYNPHQQVINCYLVAYKDAETFWVETSQIEEPIAYDEVIPGDSPEPANLPALPIQTKPGEPKCCLQPASCTLAEILEWLAERCEVAIIAQAFRVRPSWNVPLASQGQTLNRWVTETSAMRGYDFTYRDGYLMVRYPSAAFLRLSELPEPVIAPLEERARTEGGLTLDDYAQLAIELTPEQEQRFVNPPRLRLLDTTHAVCFDSNPLKQSLPALRFWASLTPQQKQNALDALPLFYNQLSTLQKRLFWEAVEIALWDWRSLTSEWLNSIQLLYAPEAEAELAFFLDRWNQETVVITLEGSPDNDQEAQTLHAENKPLREYVFHFGLSKTVSARYPLALPSIAPKPKEPDADKPVSDSKP
ncbi:MAG: hypothetical protein SNJ72_07120 [Fimbriimonadales bacterium]